MVTRGLDSHSDKYIPVGGFVQIEICNKLSGSAVLALDKYLIKAGQYVFYPWQGDTFIG